MEPDRYWFLYLGLLFVIFGSETGLAVCFGVVGFVRWFFYMTLALLAEFAALFFWALGALFCRLLRHGQEEGDETANAEE